MSDKAFGDWADSIREIVFDKEKPSPGVWFSHSVAIDLVAPELEGFNEWCEARFGQNGIEVRCNNGKIVKLTCLDPAEFFAETKTAEELAGLVAHKQAFIRDAARNAFLKRRQNVKTAGR